MFYAASEWGGLYKTTDGGDTWLHLSRHLPMVMKDVEVDPSNVNRVYATSLYDGRVDSSAGIQVSSDAGNTWSNPPTAHVNPGIDNTPQTNFACSAIQIQEIQALGISIRPDATNNVFVGTNCGLARSTDSGATWNFVDPAIPNLAAPSPGNASFVWDVVAQGGGPTGQGIVDVLTSRGHFRSTDGGNTWTGGTRVIPNSATDGVDNNRDGTVDNEAANLNWPNPTVVGSIAVSPDENYVVFIVTDTRIFESDDAGATWNEFTSPRAQGRIPFVTTNQRTGTAFDLWFADVGIARAGCTTPAAPAPSPAGPGAARRPPRGSIQEPARTPTAATWFSTPKRPSMRSR